LIDRFGHKPVLLFAGLLIVHGSAAWVFVTPNHWIIGYCAAMTAAAAWPGVELANFNIMLGMSEVTGSKRGGSVYVALNSLVGAVAGILSGLFGGIVAEWLGDWRGTLFGWPLTYHGVLFLISGAIRFLALGWLIGLEDRRATNTRAAFRYMSTNLYSNLQQAIFMPGRLLLRIGRWTYELYPAKNKPLQPKP
jgi:MFS family permease